MNLDPKTVLDPPPSRGSPELQDSSPNKKIWLGCYDWYQVPHLLMWPRSPLAGYRPGLPLGHCPACRQWIQTMRNKWCVQERPALWWLCQPGCHCYKSMNFPSFITRMQYIQRGNDVFFEASDGAVCFLVFLILFSVVAVLYVGGHRSLKLFLEALSFILRRVGFPSAS